jgi:hypothetical protein
MFIILIMAGYCDVCKTLVNFDMINNILTGCTCSKRNEAYYKEQCQYCEVEIPTYFKCVYFGHPPDEDGFQFCSGWVPWRIKWSVCKNCKPKDAVYKISRIWKKVLFQRFIKKCALKNMIRKEIHLLPGIGQEYFEGLKRFNHHKKTIWTI